MRSFRRRTIASGPLRKNGCSRRGIHGSAGTTASWTPSRLSWAWSREWCGEERADHYDELVARRAEVLRLGELVERAVRPLRDRGHGVMASTIERDLGVRISILGPDVRR